MGPILLSSASRGKVKNDILRDLVKSPKRKLFVFGSNFFCGQIMLTVRSFKEPNDKGLSSALINPK